MSARDVRAAVVAIVGLVAIVLLLVAIGWAARPSNVDHSQQPLTSAAGAPTSALTA